MTTRPLCFRIAPVEGSPPAGMDIVSWPEKNRNGRYLHNAHPDWRVIDSEAGYVLVHRQRQERYRTLAVQRFNDWNGPWFTCVPACIDSIAEADRERCTSHR